MGKQIVTIPDIGGAGAKVIEILVSKGDQIEIDMPLIMLEGDKASMEVPAEIAGVVSDIYLKLGDDVAEGDQILALEVAGDDTTVKSDAPEPVQATKIEEVTLQMTFPDLGTDAAVDVIEVLVAVGDQVECDQNLLTLEGDKASMEVPAAYTGEIMSLDIKVGDKVTSDQVFGSIKTMQQTSASDIAASQTQAPQATSHTAATEATFNNNNIYAGPAVRRVASILGVNLNKIKGTGNKGRITKDDLKNYLSKGAVVGSGLPFDLAPAPKVNFAKHGEIETKDLNKIKRATAANMQRNWLTIPHVTQFASADITDLEVYRKANKAKALEDGIRLTPIAFIMKAVVKVLKYFPNFNASLSTDGKQLIVKNYFNIGVAVDTPDGLVVPVIRDVDQKTVFEVAKELVDMSVKARDGKLTMKDMQGGTFTISSLGGIGGTAFTPIVNAPEVAILGVSKSSLQPVYDSASDAFKPRLMLPLSLSYDHRVIDGADGARFAVELTNALANVDEL